jgi:hypothetical protein
MFLPKGKISPNLISLLRSWRHPGFTVYAGPRILSGEEEAMEHLVRYLIRASFAQDRMTQSPEESRVIYASKDGKEDKIFESLERLTAMGSHVPDKGEQTVRWELASVTRVTPFQVVICNPW